MPRLKPRGYDNLSSGDRTQLLREVMSGSKKWSCFPASTSMSTRETCVVCNTHIDNLDDPWNFTIWNHKAKGGGPFDDGTTKSYSHIDCLLVKHDEIHPDNVVTTPGETRSCFHERGEYRKVGLSFPQLC